MGEKRMKRLTKLVIAPLLTAGLAVVPAQGAAKKKPVNPTTPEATAANTNTNNSKTTKSGAAHKKGQKKGSAPKKKK